MAKKIIYSEPAEYFPKELRKKYKLGEFAENDKQDNVPEKEATKFSDETEFDKLLDDAWKNYQKLQKKTIEQSTTEKKK